MPELSANKEPLVIWGASGHARVVADAALLGEHYELLGFLDDQVTPGGKAAFAGHPILGGREYLTAAERPLNVRLIFGFSDCGAKIALSHLVSLAGLKLATVVHPAALLARETNVGAGTFIGPAAVVNAGSVLGRHVIINTASSVDHDCVIGEAAHICPGVRLAGNVTVGNGAWVGIGTIVIEKKTIGTGSVIGAGSLVLDDIPPGVLAFGQPARIIRRLE